MLDLFNLPTPQGCNIQTFYVNNADSGGNITTQTWVKPRGVSNVYMLLIGSGGNGDGSNGGGSGAVTVWYGSAINVPDILYAVVTKSNDTLIRYLGSGGLITLLRGSCANGSTAGTATTAGVFAASGFYQSIAGQAGSGGDQSISSTTFLSGGAQVAGNRVQANYGYGISTTITDKNGYFLTQPIIVGSGGKDNGNGGIGCGGGSQSGKGGPGFVLIASW
jgi:hypothetical protein